MNAYRTLIPFIKRYKWHYIFGVLFLMAVDAANLLIPQVIRYFTDRVQFNELTDESIWMSVGAMMILGIFIALGRYLWRMLLYGAGRQLEYELRDKLFTQFLALDTSYYNVHKTGDLMAHATNDVTVVRMSMGVGIMMIIDSLFMTFLTLVSMVVTVGVKTTMIALASLPVISILVRIFGKKIHVRSRAVQNAFSSLSDIVQENFSGIRVTKAFAVEKEHAQNFDIFNSNYREKNLSLQRLSGIYHPLIIAISGISFVIFLVYGAYGVYVGKMTLGDFLAANNYLMMIIWPLVALGQVFNVFQRSLAALERINTILNEKSTIVEAKNPVEIKNIKGEFAFENVSFRYSEELPYVLKDISLKLENGKTLAIVGRTGCGKTTFVNLLVRLYDVSAGRITFNNIDIKNLRIKTLRENIAYAPQDNVLFSKTIQENIGFASDTPISDEEAIDAANFARIHANIDEFPEGYTTLVGERGVTLSGGQKQRLSIARTKIKDASLLIYDDSLSAVDTETEEEILENLEGLSEKSIILISQRISTVKKADRIIVLEDGRIVQDGIHETLVKEKGLYKNLYERQLLEAKLS